MTLFRRLLIPGKGLGVILRHALAVVMLHAQAVLGPRIALLTALRYQFSASCSSFTMPRPLS